MNNNFEKKTGIYLIAPTPKKNLMEREKDVGKANSLDPKKSPKPNPIFAAMMIDEEQFAFPQSPLPLFRKKGQKRKCEKNQKPRVKTGNAPRRDICT